LLLRQLSALPDLAGRVSIAVGVGVGIGTGVGVGVGAKPELRSLSFWEDVRQMCVDCLSVSRSVGWSVGRWVCRSFGR